MEMNLPELFNTVPDWSDVFTSDKFFNDAVKGSEQFNKLGLHAMRVLMAHEMVRLRREKLELHRHRDFWRYDEQGFLVVPHFLDPDGFAMTKAAVDRLPNRSLVAEDDLPKLFSRLQPYLDMTSGVRQAPSKSRVQRLRQQPDDIQTVWHIDTFYPSVKYWYFTEPVTRDNGPFVYAVASHKVTHERLCWEYKKSLEVAHAATKGDKEGSFRVIGDDIEPPYDAIVSPNTLVIANMFGVHKRGLAKKGEVRKAIHGEVRVNPFEI